MTRPVEAEDLIAEMRACRICATAPNPLPHEPRPVFQLNPEARILVCGQAPGNLVNQTGRPFTDPSGERLRDWMGIGSDVFYDDTQLAILPMGFCFPGYTAKGADKPPRKECAPAWRKQALTILPQIQLTLLIGGYAQKWHLEDRFAGKVTETVENWRDFAPDVFVLPHPSWRNNAWIKRHEWFEDELIPELRRCVRMALS
ncbi:MAG: uracil-DNA glycosylase [Ponticaulis sp.]|nr:uracil-DNA glycosylase [Ponticaulis sp.]